MRSSLSKVYSLCVMLVGCSPSGKGVLSFETPVGWTTEHKKSGGFHSYTVSGQQPLGGLLEFSQWPAPGTPLDIPTIIEDVTSRFLREARGSTKFAVASEKYSKERFTGEQCQGSFVVFEMKGYSTKTLQVMFVMSVGGNLWAGQFSGPADAWEKALSVMKGVKNG